MASATSAAGGTVTSSGRAVRTERTSRDGPNGWFRAAPQREESEVVRLTWGAPLGTSALRHRPGGGRCSTRLLRGRGPASICTRRASTSWQALVELADLARAESTCCSSRTLLARPGLPGLRTPTRLPLSGGSGSVPERVWPMGGKVDRTRFPAPGGNGRGQACGWRSAIVLGCGRRGVCRKASQDQINRRKQSGASTS